ncbi:hypothetical protein P872_01640 [Rhodonellum psychrophilum GCM71 = DSM 17998]|uniref:Polysaccharide (De)acetylase n=2 Tax=Rhodonellum TaxID=336827 RepID=U5C4Z1_9BACT|nr:MULTISPECIES: hypothetical protein [Rhodonellum]ERM83991.1 hypothetical protein P872_01640 [Rhodonellum psychrophilum GCM71 = DSM 17998]SDZ06162.1 hypothetical protein SAMN05444412_105103 [Rhodonellum ikkaensis]
MLNNPTQLKSYIGGIKTNLRGANINQKLIVFESDDWGAIRTPSRDALEHLEKKGFDIKGSLYKVDALASKEDLEDLFSLLMKFKGSDGKPAKITANAIMANPDFDKIKASDYREYHFEPFYETFKKYPKHANNLDVWKEGLKEGVFFPQFHGREHLHVNRWLTSLQKDNSKLKEAFEWGTTFSGNEDYSFMEAYDWDEVSEVSQHNEIISEGLTMFKNTFGFHSKSFIAPCYNWDSGIEETLGQNGVSCIQGLPNQYAPTGKFGNYKLIPHPFGSRNRFGQFYNVRNCIFEPATNPNIDWTDKVLGRIQAAFNLKKPAVICTHRINFVGFIDPKNKDIGLKQLERLLSQISKKWPEAKFVSTDELENYLR